jgi:hypothetical protein
MTSLMPKVNIRALEVASQKPTGFEEQATQVLQSLRTALGEVIAAIPGAGSIKRATDLQRVLGIRSTLAWQVFRVATASNPVEEGRSVPGATALERFLNAAALRGVPSSRIDDVKAAFEKFEETVRTYAGSRAAFDSMIGGLTEDGSESLDLMHKRNAFRACSHFVGARARATLACGIVGPAAENSKLLQMVVIKGLMGLSTQRKNASWGLSSIRHVNVADGSLLADEGLFPLDPTGAIRGVSFFREFCTQPMPRFEVITQGDGTLNVLVNGELIDQQSTVNLVLGFVVKGLHAEVDSIEGDKLGLVAVVRTPSEVLIHDSLVRRDICPPFSPQIEVTHDISGRTHGELHREHERLQMRENVVYLGRGADVLETEEVPRYPEMMRTAMAKVGWDPNDFDVYRCRVEYPVVPSSIRVELQLRRRA